MDQWLTVITISIIASIINILHVIFGLAKTPVNYTYLATGHYYLDYFEYLQYIVRGKAGHWLPISYYATDSNVVDWRFFPYVLLGKIAQVFRLSPMMIYWSAVFLLTIFILICFYWLIDFMLKKESFYLKIFAFLIAIFSGPFYKIITTNGTLALEPYDFWYGPATFIRRFEPVPSHLLGLLLFILILVIINKLWKKINENTNKTVLLTGLIVAVLMIALMTFSPFALFSLIPALLVFSAFYFIKEKSLRQKIFLFNLVVLILVTPTGILLRKTTGYGGFSFEVAWMEHVPWWFLLLNLGPIALVFPFGLYDYLKTNNFFRYFLLIFTVISYGLFLSPIAYYFGIHNLRFFSTISYVFYAVLTALGIKKISSFFKTYEKVVMVFLSLLLIFYSLFLVYDQLKLRIIDLDPRTPLTDITYIPNSLITGLESINHYQDKKNVLAGPYSNIAMLVPIFSQRRVFIGSPSTTTAYLGEKQSIANLFYTGQMKEDEAKTFFKKNNIGFIVFSNLDNYDFKNLHQYQFLKLVLNERSIKIWRFVEDYFP